MTSKLRPFKGFGPEPLPKTPKKVCPDSVDVGIDWISAINHDIQSLEQVKKLLYYFGTQICDDQYETEGSNSGYFGHDFSFTVTGVKGFRAKYSLPSGEDDSGTLMMFFTGKVLDSMELCDQQALLLELRQRGFTATRVDTNMDIDREYGLSLMDNANAARLSGNYKSVRNAGIYEVSSQGERTGYQLNFGSRESTSYLRMYDKFLQSKGLLDKVRLEGEFKGKQAATFVEHLMMFPYDVELFREYLISRILGVVDFIDRSQDPSGNNVSRCDRLPWWQQFIDAVEGSPFKPSIPRPVMTLERKRQWMRRQVSKSLAMLSEFYSESDFSRFVDGLVDFGRRRITALDAKMINAELLQRPGFV